MLSSIAWRSSRRIYFAVQSVKTGARICTAVISSHMIEIGQSEALPHPVLVEGQRARKMAEHLWKLMNKDGLFIAICRVNTMQRHAWDEQNQPWKCRRSNDTVIRSHNGSNWIVFEHWILISDRLVWQVIADRSSHMISVARGSHPG